MFIISLIDWLEKNSRPCFYKKTFGFECLGCGFQRSIIELLKGNLIESIKLYPALIPIIVTGVFLIVHLVFKLNIGATILKILFALSMSIMVINFLYKLIFI